MKAFVPARDFELSRRFYRAIGFAEVWATPDLAYFRHDASCFLLQNFYAEAFAGNSKMHWWVQDVDQWWSHIASAAGAFGITVERPQARASGMRDFPLIDPSGVLWQIGEALAEVR